MTIFMDPWSWWCPHWFPRTAAREGETAAPPLSKTLIIKELFYPIYSVQRALIDLLKYKLYFRFTPGHF